MTKYQTTEEHIAEVTRWATSAGIFIRRCSRHQLKIGPFNYWPKRQKFNSDELPSQRHQGFENFQQAVLAWIERSPS